MRLIAVVALALTTTLLVLPRETDAVLLAYEGFDYPEGDLDGLNGGFGWDGGWGAGGDAVILPGSLDYSDGTDSLITTGNHALIGGESGTATAVRSMASDMGLEEGTYWISFTGQRQLPHEDTPNNYARAAAFQMFHFGSDTDEQLSVGKRTTPVSGTVTQTWDVYSIESDGSDDSSGVDQSEQIMALMQVIVAGDPDDADDDTVNLWVNPSLDENDPLGTPDAVNSGIEDYQFNGLRLFAGGTTGDGEYAQMAIDEIRIGTELGDALTGVIVAGDTSGDGVVTVDDLDPIRENYRQMVEFRNEGDLDGDGLVTFADFREFKTGLLDAGGSLDGVNLNFLNVPEPATVCTLLGGLLGLGVMRRRRKRAIATLGVALAATLLAAPAANAAISVVGDPEFNYNGVNDNSPSVFTVDPFNDPLVTDIADRGIAENRMLRQTFKNPTTINVGEIVVSFDVTGGASEGSDDDTGLGLRIYEVDDVLAGTWIPGDLVAEILSFDTLPSSSESLSFELTEGDIFELPARSEGTMGYGLEISTPLASPSDGNPGVLFFSDNADGTDFYPDGRYYTESGDASNDHRDLGVSLIATADPTCMAGDVNCDGAIDVETDLQAIADHFRQDVTMRSEGDLTGDGFVNFDDFDEWKSNFAGSTANLDLGFLGAPVPEPGTWLLLAAGTAALVAVRRRQT